MNIDLIYVQTHSPIAICTMHCRVHCVGCRVCASESAYVIVYAWVFTCMHVFLCMCVYVCSRVCMCISACMCVYVFMCVCRVQGAVPWPSRSSSCRALHSG